MDYEEAPDSDADDNPFPEPADLDSDDERNKKKNFPSEIVIDRVDQTIAAPKLNPDVVSFAEVRKPNNLQEARKAVLEINRHELDELSLQFNAGLGV